MRIKLGRKQIMQRLPFTGRTFCGCQYFQGVLFAECKDHAGGKHRVAEFA